MLRDWMRARRGRAYDPSVVEAFERVDPDARCGARRARTNGRARWRVSLNPWRTVGPEALDVILTAFAAFADLKSPWIRGHSRAVASLAEGAARHAGLDDGGAMTCARRARPRPRAGRRRERDLGQAGAAHDGGVGAGAAAPVLHRADPRPVRRAGAARRAGVVPPRAPRRIGVPPLAPRRGPVARRSDPGRGGRVRGQPRAAAPPRLRRDAAARRSRRRPAASTATPSGACSPPLGAALPRRRAGRPG